MDVSPHDYLEIRRAENGWVVSDNSRLRQEFGRFWVAPTAFDLGVLVQALVTGGMRGGEEQR